MSNAVRPEPRVHPYHRPVELPFSLPTRLYGGMLVVWLLRPALQRRFPLHKGLQGDYLNFLAWCTSLGRRQYRLLREISAWNEELMRPMAMPALSGCGCRWQASYNVGMYLAGITRAKYWQGQLLHGRAMRHRAARWYFRDGRRLLGLPECPAWQRQALVEGFDNPETFVQALLLPKDRRTDGEQAIREGVADIIEAWQTAGDAGVPPREPPAATPWWSRLAGRWLPAEANELAWLRNELLLKIGANVPRLGEIERVMQAVPIEGPGESLRRDTDDEPGKPLPWGVNLVGYARGELGIGEDVRMLARSLEAAGVPFCIINVEPGANVSQADTTAEQWIADEPRYAISLFCMTGIEMSRMTLEKGLGWLDGRYNIGLWPWELPKWPRPWHHAWNLVDELWGISHYTAEAYAQAPVPVLPMPLPVVIDRIADLGRAHWELPKEAYLFVFSFDMNSTLSRKNPVATVRAFITAFESSGDEVGLVIKVSHLDRSKPSWKALEELIKRDSRIYLVSGELRKDEVLALYRCCNCFVSLHRSEGFGRGLAEAQLLGLDLIATGYSGNMSFCSDNATRTVDYRLVDVEEGEYFFGTGQQWAEPDIAHAAEQMRQCVEAQSGAPHYATARFSLAHCGEMYRDRLEVVYAGRFASPASDTEVAPR